MDGFNPTVSPQESFKLHKDITLHYSMRESKSLEYILHVVIHRTCSFQLIVYFANTIFLSLGLQASLVSETSMDATVLNTVITDTSTNYSYVAANTDVDLLGLNQVSSDDAKVDAPMKPVFDAPIVSQGGNSDELCSNLIDLDPFHIPHDVESKNTLKFSSNGSQLHHKNPSSYMFSEMVQCPEPLLQPSVNPAASNDESQLHKNAPSHDPFLQPSLNPTVSTQNKFRVATHSQEKSHGHVTVSTLADSHTKVNVSSSTNSVKMKSGKVKGIIVVNFQFFQNQHFVYSMHM